MDDRRYPQSFQTAELVIEGSQPIKVLFNPTEYKITKANTWNYTPVTGKSFPQAEFGGGMPRVIALTLFLDQSLVGPGGSVRGITDRLFLMMEAREGRPAGSPEAAPPFVTFRWGAVNTFKAACTSLTVTFQMFHPNGEPTRAEVGLELKQAEPAPRSTNLEAATTSGFFSTPATRPAALGDSTPVDGASGQAVHAVQDGDSLPTVAQNALGDPNRWRDIAEASGIDNPLDLPRGLPLTIPPVARR